METILINLRNYKKYYQEKKKGSNNYIKTEVKLGKLKRKICLQREDYLHKLSMYLIRTYQQVNLEDLQIRNMIDNEKTVLTDLITNAAWGKFLRYVEYKAKWYGRDVMKVDSYFPSS